MGHNLRVIQEHSLNLLLEKLYFFVIVIDFDAFCGIPNDNYCVLTTILMLQYPSHPSKK